MRKSPPAFSAWRRRQRKTAFRWTSASTWQCKPMEDQEAFDALFGSAKYHVAAASYASRLNPLEAIFLSILLEHQKALDDLKARLAEAPSGKVTNRGPQAASEGDRPDR